MRLQVFIKKFKSLAPFSKFEFFHIRVVLYLVLFNKKIINVNIFNSFICAPIENATEQLLIFPVSEIAFIGPLVKIKAVG